MARHDTARQAPLLHPDNHPRCGGTALSLAYMASFFSDVPQLVLLKPKFRMEEVVVQHVRILVLPKDTTRRPRGVVETVEMRGGATCTTGPRSDLQIARSMLHRRVIDQHNGINDGLLAELIPSAFDFDAPIGPGYQYAPPVKSLTPSGSLDLLKTVSGGTRIVTQRTPTTEEARITSPEFERERAANIGKDEMNGGQQDRALMGRRRWR